MVSCVVDIRHHPARAPRFPGTFTLCLNSAHPCQNKDFITNVFSHTCALLRRQPLSFYTLHKNTRGGISPCFSKRRGDMPAPSAGAPGRRIWWNGLQPHSVGFVPSKAPAPQSHPGRKERASLLQRARRCGRCTSFELSTFNFEHFSSFFRPS